MPELHGIDGNLFLASVVLDVRRHEALREEEDGDPYYIGSTILDPALHEVQAFEEVGVP